MHVAYFTAGRTGAGHVVRGIAIRRALARAGARVEFRMFGPEVPFAIGQSDYAAVPIERGELRDPSTARDGALARALRAWKPDLLLVDGHWAPLRFVLPIAGCEAWLIARMVPPNWFTGPEPAVQWEASQYARAIAIEPFAAAALTERIDPVVVANPDEKRPAGALRARLGVARDQRLHVVSQAGRAGECAALVAEVRARDPSAVTVGLDLFDPAPLFPACEWLDDADALTLGAGYNAWWEAWWLGYAAKATFAPQARVGDDQAWRAAHAPRAAPRANGADTLAAWIAAR
jgi:hypothetical protein